MVNQTFDMLGNKTQQKVSTTGTSVRTTGYVYDNRGNLTRTYTGNDRTVYEYDPAGNKTAQETGKNGEISRTEYQYDALNRLTKLTDSLGNSETYTYSGIYLTSQKDRNGVTTSYTYDKMGRVISEKVGNKTTTYTYGTGALVTQANENAAITNKYNEQGLVNRVRTDYKGQYNEIYYYYTDDGKMLSYTASNNGSTMTGTFDFGYTLEGDLKEVKSGNTIKAAYTYDNDSNLTSAVYNGTNITKNYSYYENGALKNVTNKSGNTIVSLYNCEYQLDGNLSKVTDSKGEQKTYTYSSTGRLANETYKKGAVTESTDYTYDSRGNRLSAVYTSSQSPEDNCKKMYLYDTNNRLLRERKDYTSRNADTEIYRYYYDNNGNQIKKVSNKITANASTENMSVGICLASENSGYDVEKRTYDVYNRLTEVKKNNSTLGTYTYLPNDLRLSKTVGNNTTYFMWSGDDILAELNGSYAVTAQYVYGTERIYNCINNNYYLYNNHGDTSEVTNANGIVVKSYSLNGFDAYGDEKNPDSNDTNPFRYCGEYYDAETGNIYLRARYYDPSTGGFITEDPARDGVNWYGYCGGNPVSFWDPSGLERIVISGGVYSENPVHGKFDYNFIETALRAINDNLAENNQESVTWIIADAGYTKEDKLNFRKSIDGLNVNIVYIESDEAFVDYINNKDGNNRNSDKITRVDIFSHGLVGEVDLGYNYVDNNGKKLSLDYSDIKNMSSSAFNNPITHFWSCNTGTNGNSSFAQQWVNCTGGVAYAFDTKTSYSNIMYTEDYLSANKIERRLFYSVERKIVATARGELGFSRTGSFNYPVSDEGRDPLMFTPK